MKRRVFLQHVAASAFVCGCELPAWAQGIKPSAASLPTKQKMQAAKHFCGFADPPHPSSGGLVPQSYGLKGAGRGKSALTWSFAGNVPGINDVRRVLAVLKSAFNLWQAPVPALSFTNVNGNADIAITVADLGPPNPTGGQLLAKTSGDGRSIQINSEATFAPDNAALGAAGGNSLLSVITHEIGHALGLLHATTESSIMFSISSSQETLGPDDIAAIKALYGWAPQVKLQGGTEQSPSLCACGNTLVMVWRGAGDNRNIWISTSTDGASWTPQRPFRDVGTIGSPALAWDGARLWMVWRGTGDDQGLYYKSSTDFFIHDNPGQANIRGVGSSHGPRIAVINGTPLMVWKGVNDDHGIYFSQLAGNQWQRQARVPNVGTSAAPAVCQDFGGGARLLWRGVGSDQKMWTTFTAGSLLSWQPQTTLSWPIEGNGTAGVTSIGTAGTAAGPALANVGNVIQAAWRGVDGDDGVYFTQLAPDAFGPTIVNEWSSQARIPNVGSSDGPALAAFGGKLHAAWKGIPNDTGLYSSVL